MLNREWIRATEDFVRRKFDGGVFLNAHPEQKAYRIEHTYRVANIGRQIALREGFDETELVLACLLHDVSYCEEFGEEGWAEHGRISARISRPFLEALGLPEERIRDICYGIAIHVDDKADFEGERTPFALSVGDADNIDRMGPYRIHEGLCYDRFLEMELDGKIGCVSKRIARIPDLLAVPMGTRTAVEMWKERVGFLAAFYKELSNQLEHSKIITD